MHRNPSGLPFIHPSTCGSLLNTHSSACPPFPARGNRWHWVLCRAGHRAHLCQCSPSAPLPLLSISPAQLMLGYRLHNSTGVSARCFSRQEKLRFQEPHREKKWLNAQIPPHHVDTFLPPTRCVAASSRGPQGALLQLHAHQPDGERAAVPRQQCSPQLITHLWAPMGSAGMGRDTPGSSR